MKKTNLMVACILAVVFCCIVIFMAYIIVGYATIAINRKIDAKWSPCNQLGTTWCTEDGKASFSVSTDEDDLVTGKICVNGEETDIYLIIGGFNRKVYIMYSYNYTPEDAEEKIFHTDEMWAVKKVRKDMFVAIVKNSNHFEEGEVLTFYKVK